MPVLKPLVKADIRALYRLRVRSDQETFVGPNGLTMAQAPFEPGSEIFGIWEGETAVGLLAIIDFSHPQADLQDGDDPNSLYIWRLLIDADHQKRGYGTLALNHAKKLMHDKGLPALYIAAVDKAGSAIPLYEREGFCRTGRIVEGETELIWRP